MTETDLQLGGGYTYQWECAILLALNSFFKPVRYSPNLFDLIESFLGGVSRIHLEGEDRERGIDLEDINLIKGDRRILIQVKTKQAEGERWTLSDRLLLKALYRFYNSRLLAEEPEATRFVFLTNRGFNRDLVDVKKVAIGGDIAACDAAERLGEYLGRYARDKGVPPLDLEAFRQMLARTRLVHYLAVDAVKANIQNKLDALGREDWQTAHALLFEDFAKRSTQVGGGTVTPASVLDVLGTPPGPPTPLQIDTGGGAYVHGDVHVYGGDVVGRDQTKVEPPRWAPAARPTVPAEGEPLTLIAAALEARRLLLVWADVPFPPEERPSAPAALRINRWQEDARKLQSLTWPVAELPPLTMLSLDPSDRVEVAFDQAQVLLHILRGQEDVIDWTHHNLIKMGGDLLSRSGLLLSWADVRDVPNRRDKAHLLREARRVAQDGVVVMFAERPGEPFRRLWKEMVRTDLGAAKHGFALGPARFRWPKSMVRLGSDVEGTLSAVADAVNAPAREPALEESDRRQTPDPSELTRPKEPAGDGPFSLRETKASFERALGAFVRRTMEPRHAVGVGAPTQWRVLRRRRSEDERRSLSRVTKEYREWERITAIEEADSIKLTAEPFRGLTLELTEKDEGLWVTIDIEGDIDSDTVWEDGRWIHRGYRPVPVDLRGHGLLAAWLRDLSQEEVDHRPLSASVQSRSLPYRAEMQAIRRKLDRLLAGQTGLLQGQGVICRQIHASERETIDQVLAGLQGARWADAEVRRELRGTMEGIRRALVHLQEEHQPDLDDEIRRTLDEVTEVLRAELDLRTGLELTVPLIPLLLSYKTTLETGTGLDLRQLWEDLVELLGSPRQEGDRTG